MGILAVPPVANQPMGTLQARLFLGNCREPSRFDMQSTEGIVSVHSQDRAVCRNSFCHQPL